MKILYLAAAGFLVAACAGSPIALQQAEQQCLARGHAPASVALQTCVDQVSDGIYRSWGRDAVNKGD